MAFLNPNDWADEWYAENSYQFKLDDHVEKELERYKKLGLTMLSTLSNSIFSEEIAVTIAFGYLNGLKDAEKIVEQYKLEDKHIAALLDDSDWMKKMLNEEIMNDQAESDYYDSLDEGYYGD